MIHAAIFASTDPAERATLIVTGARDQVALNVPPGGCWRPMPTASASAVAPMLGDLAAEPVSAETRTL